MARGARGGGAFSTSFIGGGGGGAGLGGAIFNRGALSVEASTLTGNQAIGGDGGASGAIPLPIVPTAYFAVGAGGGGLDGVTPTSAAGGGPNGGSYGSGTGGYGGGGGGAVYNRASPAGSGGLGGGGGGSAYRDIGPNARGGDGGFGGGGANANGGLMTGGTGGFGGGDGCLSYWGGLGGGGGGLGGAIFSDAGSVNIVNSTLVGNSALGGQGCRIGAGLGGAVFSRNGSLTAHNSTVSDNSTAAIRAYYWLDALVSIGFGLDSGGGIFVVGDGATATVNLNNTIIANSAVGPNQAYDYTAMTTSAAGSALSQSGSDNLIELSHGFGGPPVFNPDPQLGPLQDNGGPTWTMAPAAGSPAIDAIPAPGNGALATDQRGVARPYGAGVDIGAVEVAPALPPTITSAPPANGTYGTAYSHSFTATGGPSLSYSVASGSLPLGLALDGSTGQLAGTPTQAGSFGPLTIAASNAIGSATQSVTIAIAPATLTVIADAKTQTHGEANPDLTYSVGGLVNGDTDEAVLTGTLETTATISSPPGSYAITQGSQATNANYTISFTGATLTIVAAPPPPSARALAINFWRSRASCANVRRGQEPVLDQTLALATGMTTYLPGGLVLSAQGGGGGWPNFAPAYALILKGDPSTPDAAPDCAQAVNLLNKITIDGKARKANDPLFKLAAQLLAAQLNYFAGAAQNDATTSNIQHAVLLLGTYSLDGLSYSPGLASSDARTATCLATQLNNYNNNRAVTTCP